MRRSGLVVLCSLVFFAVSASAGPFDNVLKGFGSAPSETVSDDGTTASGLKEALSVGTSNAVRSVSKVDGYFGNQLIRILMPEKLRNVADVLSKVGFQKEIDDFILSMNRAAEKAAPKAASIFTGAIKEMSFDDARQILSGGDTAATDFFKRKTSEKLYAEFKPVISSSVSEVGVTHSYKKMMSQYETIPFMKKESVDLDHYVTNKALDGLFLMIGQEEKKIRTDPAARVTDLLKKVFGK